MIGFKGKVRGSLKSYDASSENHEFLYYSVIIYPTVLEIHQSTSLFQSMKA